jgi:hypothetical protein
MKFVSEVEKICIQNDLKRDGFFIFSNHFVLDLVLMSGEYYNKYHYIEEKEDGLEVGRNNNQFIVEVTEKINNKTCEDSCLENTTVYNNSEYYPQYNNKMICSDNSFVFYDIGLTNQSTAQLAGNPEYPGQPLMSPCEINACFDSFEDLISYVEALLDKYGDIMILLARKHIESEDY